MQVYPVPKLKNTNFGADVGVIFRRSRNMVHREFQQLNRRRNAEYAMPVIPATTQLSGWIPPSARLAARILVEPKVTTDKIVLLRPRIGLQGLTTQMRLVDDQTVMKSSSFCRDRMIRVYTWTALTHWHPCHSPQHTKDES